MNPEKMTQVDEQTLKENEFKSKEFYKKHPELNMPKLTGSFKRKLIRQNTIHLRGICPNCGRPNIRFYKRIETKAVTANNRWYCKGCGKAFKREDLEYVKYA